MKSIENQASQREVLEQYLRNLYGINNSPTAYTGLSNLRRQIKHDIKEREITSEVLEKWLEEQYT